VFQVEAIEIPIPTVVVEQPFAEVDHEAHHCASDVVRYSIHVEAERFGSGDGERKTLLARKRAFEPLPASVLLFVAV
jgi:hypothetical protein